MIQFTKSIAFCCLFMTIMSCASMGSKEIYCDKSLSINKSSKIIIAKPILVNCIENKDIVYSILKQQISSELKPFDIIVSEDTNTIIENFDEIKADSILSFETTTTANFVLLTKLTRLTAMQKTRDYKIEYKLVSLSQKKLQFHSKFNTTVGGTVVIVPGINEYPNSDRIMLMAISSGLHKLKKKL